jgi:predicted metal-dependent phosphoesterase TrpH
MYSYDGLMSPKTILKTAEHKGLNAIAITDHNTIQGGVLASRISREENSKVTVIIGEEISTNIGDVIGLFLSNEIKSMNVLEAISEIHSQGGVVLVPHPFRGHDLRGLSDLVSKTDLIEIFNSRSPIKLEQIQYLKTLNKTLVGCSDAHFPQEIGLCKSISHSCYSEIDEIRKFLLDPSKIVAWGSEGSMLFHRLSQVVKLMKSTTFLRKILPPSI